MQDELIYDAQKELDGMILDENKKEQCEDDPRAATAPTPGEEDNESSSIMSSSSSSYDSDDDKNIPWPMTSYLSSSATSTAAANEYCHSMGSFSVSVLTTSSPIDFIDEQGNLPLTQVSSILPAVAEEQEDDISEADGALLLQFVPTQDKCRTSTSSTENDTLSTAGTGTTTVCTTTSSSYRLPESPQSSNMERIHLESIEQHQSRVASSSIDSCSCTNENQMRAAMLVMKDVIFRQRSAMKKVSKEQATLQKKYEFCKLQNSILSKANQEINKGMKRTLRKSEALEQEVINLRNELLIAKEEILRLKNQEI